MRQGLQQWLQQRLQQGCKRPAKRLQRGCKEAATEGCNCACKGPAKGLQKGCKRASTELQHAKPLQSLSSREALSRKIFKTFQPIKNIQNFSTNLTFSLLVLLNTANALDKDAQTFTISQNQNTSTSETSPNAIQLNFLRSSMRANPAHPFCSSCMAN